MSKENEKQFFDQEFEFGTRKSLLNFYKIAKSSREHYEKSLLSNCCNKKVLEYGCGPGSYAFSLAKHGARVVGIDISDVAIKRAKARAEEEGLNNITFLVMDAEEMQFEDSSFDMVCGRGIVHHLHIDKSFKEIVRILKPEGKAIFMEPMAHNPAINLFRRLTPRFRTEDEHPLTNKDLGLIKEFFYRANYSFFHLFSFLAIPFRDTGRFYSFLKILDNLDEKLFEWVPLMKLLAWRVIIILEGPKK